MLSSLLYIGLTLVTALGPLKYPQVASLDQAVVVASGLPALVMIASLTL